MLLMCAVCAVQEALTVDTVGDSLILNTRSYGTYEGLERVPCVTLVRRFRLILTDMAISQCLTCYLFLEIVDVSMCQTCIHRRPLIPFSTSILDPAAS